MHMWVADSERLNTKTPRLTASRRRCGPWERTRLTVVSPGDCLSIESAACRRPSEANWWTTGRPTNGWPMHWTLLQNLNQTHSRKAGGGMALLWHVADISRCQNGKVCTQLHTIGCLRTSTVWMEGCIIVETQKQKTQVPTHDHIGQPAMVCNTEDSVTYAAAWMGRTDVTCSMPRGPSKYIKRENEPSSHNCKRLREEG